MALALGACETAPSAPSPDDDCNAPPYCRRYNPPDHYGGFFGFRHEFHRHREGGHDGHHH